MILHNSKVTDSKRLRHAKIKKHQRRWWPIAIFSALLFFGVGWWSGLKLQTLHPAFSPYWSKVELQAKLKNAPGLDEILRFRKNEVLLPGDSETTVFDFAFDPSLQSFAEDLIAKHKPDLGVLVALDASTGRVLAMVAENRSFEIDVHPALHATYPSASVFKVITATAAIEQKQLRASTLIPYAGRDHTLYKSQVLKEEVSGWRRSSSLKDAFARSINTVFGRIGVFQLGQEPLKSFADRYGFNQLIPSEFPIDPSQSASPNTAYELAEMASGFTPDNLMSPLHGAMIASAIANDGKMMEPFFVYAAYRSSGKTLYQAEPKVFSTVMNPATAVEVQRLMRETVVAGTSKKSFRGFFRGKYNELDVGGKTGSLTDRQLGGKADWFVGYAQSHGRKIAIAVLTMHKKYWTVKSSYLARRTFESAFSSKEVAWSLFNDKN